VAAGILVLALTFSPALILIPYGPVYIVAILFATAVAMLAIAAARRGRVQLAVLVFLTNYVIAILASVVWVGEVTSGPLFCLLIVTLAGALLRPAQVAGVYVATMSLMVAMPLLVGGDTQAMGYLELMLCVALVSAFTAFTAAATSLDIRRALHAAVQANEVLEARVMERTAQLEELTVRDPLTGWHNRRHLAEELPRMDLAARRSGTDSYLAALDVDNFKSINDAFGHAGGEDVLSELAACLRAGVRAGDLTARVGGEEFVVVFADATLADAHLTCERIRLAISAIAWPELSEGLRVTVTMGLASTATSRTSQDLWIAADALLYDANREPARTAC